MIKYSAVIHAFVSSSASCLYSPKFLHFRQCSSRARHHRRLFFRAQSRPCQSTVPGHREIRDENEKMPTFSGKRNFLFPTSRQSVYRACDVTEGIKRENFSSFSTSELEICTRSLPRTKSEEKKSTLKG